ncbi:succinylglutamate desuccinylase/aspartoacylase domain-containing protein [Shinella zoogloeoides]|uniref:succinylglutamate desuccinylase/aspartoacylase domain-containing protein n=1 Tax=Shinella zoogloeoides TaxID=352475 RepID=UPI00273DDF89|nr:succinylglutamate desuccinylase/aspartoacylase family protein [Shinella zoogloeoides]WLR92748.1 succinylglutamate desuccinylase/aspartoacylase family protein [Shinella zoogloeoides]
MECSEIIIGGDTAGIEWRVPVFRFKGSDAAAPSVHIQAALHANELPGTALAHFLIERLRRAEEKGTIRGDITVVPQANPIGLAQYHFGEMEGRFDLGSRTNFNRDFPLVALAERETLLDDLDRRPAADRLKRTLLHMALGVDLVLDLHCDDESLQYAYIDEAFWPEAADLASALDMEAVFLSDGESTAFEEAVGHAFKRQGGDRLKTVPGRLAVTVELRGRRDVYPDIAMRDADGLWRFLAGRGVVTDAAFEARPYAGPAVPLDNIEMVRAPAPGTVLFHRDIGDRVKAGDLLATLITRPGEADGTLAVKAGHDGLVATRSSARYARRGDDLMKLACREATRNDRKPGTLED